MPKSPRSPALADHQEHLALAVAAVTLAGSLYMSMGMGLVACPLCFYQRTFIMAVVSILGVGMGLRLPVAPGTLSLLAFPLAVAGLGVAVVHCNLVWTEVLACPNGVFGVGRAPEQSLVAYLATCAALLPGAARSGLTQPGAAPRLAALAGLGAVLTAFSVLSSPKLPPFKPKYDAAGNRLLAGCERAKPEPGTETPKP